MMGGVEHEVMNRCKWLKVTEYVLLVDRAVELQNSFQTTSANSLSPMNSPNRNILSSRPGILV